MISLSRRRLIVRRWSRVTIRPAAFARKGNRGLDPDLMPGRSAKLQRLQPPAEQIDVVNGLRALIAAVDHATGKNIGAILPADPDVFRPQRDYRRTRIFPTGKRVDEDSPEGAAVRRKFADDFARLEREGTLYISEHIKLGYTYEPTAGPA